MKIGIVRETAPGERRVALVPDGVNRLVKAGHEVYVQQLAGQEAGIADQAYEAQGGVIVSTETEIFAKAGLLLAVRPPDIRALSGMRPYSALAAILQPLATNPNFFQMLAEQEITSFSLDAMPRISRAQNMDVLSSMSTVAGYRATIVASELLGRFFPMLMTAAGTITPAKVLVLGVGVAGLQAIATAHRLGAVVQAFDTRPVVRDQVESLGATFLALDLSGEQTREGYATELAEEQHVRELALLAKPVAEADVIITTALVPGRRAPILLTQEMVSTMKPGAVIVDMAGEAGGNCEVSVPGQTIVHQGITITAPLDLASQMPLNSSQLYSRNMVNFVTYLLGLGFGGGEAFKLDDEIIARTCMTHDGKIVSTVLQQRIESVTNKGGGA
ncbi:MAG: Re/Si-specific NAD(P)(+) transhydrogenase subunit alpha [Sulfobacillus sp.]